MIYLPQKDKCYAFAIWSVPIIIIPFLIFFYSLTMLIVFILSILLSFWMWNSTSYKIENGELCIKSWIFRKKVNIKDIVKVKKTRNCLASYALALNRLEITEKSKNKYYISPNNFETFIAELKKYNSDMIVN